MVPSATVDAISSVELVTSKDNNGQICTCTGRHILWANDKTQQHNITVYCKPSIIGPTGVCVIIRNVVGWSTTYTFILH
jgi:L-2-hydroxyglutarate oxidase LhgO